MTTVSLDWLATYAIWVMVISVASLIVALALLPMVLARIPADYFCRRPHLSTPARGPLAFMGAVARNLFGGVLVAVGILTLFTPGQGLITLLAGLMIANYPGKHAIERWLIKRPRVLETVNWMRTRSGQAPLLHPDDCGEGS